MKKLIDWFKQIFQFIRYDIWRITGQELSRTRRVFYSIIKTIFLAIKGFGTNRLGIRASALTYSISFAIVPLFAVIFAIARGFGIESNIQNALQSTFAAQADLIPVIMDFIKKYLDTMSGGIFIGIGFIIVVYSVYNLFAQIERALNSIWQVEKSRSFIRQFTMYFSGLFIFPLLMAVSSGLTIYINNFLKQTFLFEIFTPVAQFGLTILPYLTSGMVFTLIYLVIPNTRVRFVNALIAGMTTGVFFQLFQVLYINGQINLTRYNAVYGGFAAIPLLLLWINISSLIFLIGAEISYVSQNLQHFDYRIEAENINNRYKRFLTLFVVYLIVKQFENNEPPINEQKIVSEHKLPIHLLNQILGDLSRAGIIVGIEGKKGDFSYIPAVDIAQLSIGMVDNKLDAEGSEFFIEANNEEMEKFWNKISEIDQVSGETFDKALIKDLI